MNINRRSLPFVSSIIVLISLLGHHFAPGFRNESSALLVDFIDGSFVFTFWIGISLLINYVVDRYVWPRLFGPHIPGEPRQRKLVMQLVHVIIVGIGIGLALKQLLMPELGTMVAGSGVIAIVLGLALQNTLGDFFAGVALNLERPFKAGDWITLEDKSEGLVLLVNWRATHIRTRTADILVVPNSTIAKSRLINRIQPTKLHIANFNLKLMPGFDFDVLKAHLNEAAFSVTGIKHLPKPLIYIDNFGDWMIGIRMYYFIENYDALLVIQGELGNAVYAKINSHPTLKEFWPRFALASTPDSAAGLVTGPATP
jgi:small-conductance mechanosensitive channel